MVLHHKLAFEAQPLRARINSNPFLRPQRTHIDLQLAQEPLTDCGNPGNRVTHIAPQLTLAVVRLVQARTTPALDWFPHICHDGSERQ